MGLEALGLNEPLPDEALRRKSALRGFAVGVRDTAVALRALDGCVARGRGQRPVSRLDAERNLVAVAAGADLAACREKLAAAGVEFSDAARESECELGFREVLERVLPAGARPPTAFEVLGQRAVLSLKPETLPFKFAVGQALLRTHRGLRSVYLKAARLANEFRTPELLLLAGDAGLDAVVAEGRVALELDISAVYFCSKLEHERSRVLEKVAAGGGVVDAFCGVGPFALRAARERGCRVYANDLNPACFEYLVRNIRRNKAEGRVEAHNLDAGAFLESVLRRWARGELGPLTDFFLNLPGLAVDFLAAFGQRARLPAEFAPFRVHVYCFEAEQGDAARLRQALEARVAARLGECAALARFDDVHVVKHVSNAKLMCCVSLTLRPGPPAGEPRLLAKRDAPGPGA